jgi:hypothetical protein
MISRVFRNPPRVDSSEHPVREGEGNAALQYSAGGNVSSGLEDAASNRLPKTKIINSGPDGTTRCSGRYNKESIRRFKGRFLSVRQESEEARYQENEERSGLLDKARTSNSGTAGRWAQPKEDSVETGQRTSGPGQSSFDGKEGDDEGNGSFPKVKEEKPKRCFLVDRDCTDQCMAYSNDRSEKCKVLGAVNALMRSNVSRPVLPSPPKVAK